MRAAPKTIKKRGKKMTDRKYTEKRNAMIPGAEALANRLHGANAPSVAERDVWADNWNRAYHDEMERLTEGLGK